MSLKPSILWLALCLNATAAQPPRATVIRNVILIDPGSNLVAPRSSVLIVGDRIQAAGVITEPPGAAIVDGAGGFLIPGLWDMHVHLWNANNQLELYLAFGVTGVRDMGSSFETTSQLRRQIEENGLLGPHILTSGPGIDGGASDDPRLPILTVTSPEQARTAVDTLHGIGVDFLKIFSRIELEPYMALMERARQLRMTVAGHLPTKVRIEDAIELKQAGIEHLFGLERASERRLRKAFVEAAAAGTRFTPTLTMHQRTLALNAEALTADPRLQLIPEELKKDWGDPKKDWAASTSEFQEKAPKAFAHYQEMARWLKESGVTILAGSDTGDPFTIPGASLQDELVLLVQAGLTPMEALRGATSEAARFVRLESSFGAIQPGLWADLVLLKENPLDDIRNVRKVLAVWWRGRHYDKNALDALSHRSARDIH